MKIKWESCSRAKALVAEGKISEEDIIARTTTGNFPSETAVVRMAKPADPKPFVTVHIRGPEAKTTNAYGYSYDHTPTCRVNFGGTYDNAMNSNGILDESLNWQDVHKIVEEVKEKLDI